MTSRRSGDHGFTLIELLVVIAVLGLAMGITASFVPRRSARLDLANAADLVANSLRSARVEAIAGGRAVLVQVAPDGRGMVIDGALRLLPGGVQLQTPGQVRFAPDGSATPVRFRLWAPGTSLPANRITVDWLSGRVVVTDET